MQRLHASFVLPGLLAALVTCGGGTSPRSGASTPVRVLEAATSSAPSSRQEGQRAPGSRLGAPLTFEAATAIVAAADRSKMDRELDAGRQPAKMLEFFQIAPGMKVAELAAATGYTAELLARAVGPTGTVYGQNPRWVLEQYAEKWWSRRLTKPVMQNAVRVDREFEDPLPSELHDLDAVFCVLFYHDFFWLNVDRDQVNHAVFKSLRPGGLYAVIDHSSRPGAEGNDAKTLHRVEERIVRREIEKAGFRLRAEASFLRHPEDMRDWNAAPETQDEAAARRGKSDRFVLAFERP
jgi:predicted methyltransferase